jgi:signal peptide peptidase SppA
MKLSALGHQFWSMTPDARIALSERMDAIAAVIAAGVSLDDAKSASPADTTRRVFNGGNPLVPEINGEVATLEVIGDIIARAPWFAKAYCGVVDPYDLADAVDALAVNDAVKVLRIEIDSCGGTVAGAAEAAAALTRFQAAGKTVEVFASGVLASSAYRIVCGADKITATDTTIVGSLGVYHSLCDTTGAQAQAGIRSETIASTEGKGLGADGRITPAQREQIQRRVDAFHAVMRSAVEAGRGFTVAQADAVFTGDTWVGAEALALDLIDAVGSPADDLDQPEGDAPAPELVVPVPLTGVSSDTAKASTTPPAAAGTQESDIMDKQLQAALAALITSHPTLAAQITAKALADGTTADGLKAFASELVGKTVADELTATKAKLATAEKLAADEKARADKADADLAAAKAHGQPEKIEGDDTTKAANVRKIPIANSANLTKEDHADILAGKAALV